jgi:hypothetical protein
MPTRPTPFRLLLLALSVAAIAAATLVPIPQQAASTALTPWYCLLCGQEGSVDVILNVALFVPFGVMLGVFGMRHWRAALVGGGMSLAIELLQATVVTGRDPSLSDVLTNTLGTLLGAMIGGLLPALWRPTRAWARYLALATGVAWLAVVGLTAVGLQPERAHGLVKRLDAPTVPLLEQFRGDVTSAAADSEAGHLGLSATIITGPISDRLAPVVELDDGSSTPLARLGQLGQKPTFSRRLLATRARFHTPVVRLYGSVLPAVPTAAAIEGAFDRSVLRAAATVHGTRHEAALPLTPGSGWMLLLPLGYPFDIHHQWTSALWLGLPLLLTGFWTGRGGVRPAAAVAGFVLLLGLGLEVVPWLSALPRDGMVAWMVGLVALVTGWMVGRT